MPIRITLALHVSRAESGKALYFDVIPRNVDEYLQFLEGYRSGLEAAAGNPVWHIHSGEPPRRKFRCRSLAVNLVSASNAENASTLWGFIGRYRPGITPQSHPTERARGVCDPYCRDFVLRQRSIGSDGRRARRPWRSARCAIPASVRRHCRADPGRDLRSWAARAVPRPDKKPRRQAGVSLEWSTRSIRCCSTGERTALGSFVAVYGVGNTIAMIDGALARSA